MLWLLGLAAVALFGYAVYVQFEKGDSAMPTPARVWAAVVAAGALVGASIMSWFS